MLNDLYAIAYLSVSRSEFNRPEFSKLATQARHHNAELDISGYLCYTEGIFFQYLEGPRHEVTALMNAIENDHRHTVINLLHIGNIKERKFMGWAMRYMDDEESEQAHLEDMIQWIVFNVKTELMALDTLKKNIYQMVQKIKFMRNARQVG